MGSHFGNQRGSKALQIESPTRAGCTPASKPFTEDFAGFSWNSQALFTKNPRHRAKKGLAMGLLKESDFGFLQETHGVRGSDYTLSLPKGIEAFWSHNSPQEDGVAIWIKQSFLANFDKPQKDDWEEIVKGRVAILHLNGPKGALDLVVCYLKAGVGSDHKALKKSAMDKLHLAIRPQDKCLTVVAGDWNMVAEQADRLDLDNGKESDVNDKGEFEYFVSNIAKPHRLWEIHQEEMTYMEGGSASRLDRAYANVHDSDQLTHRWVCTALKWPEGKPRISAHRPIRFARISEGKKGEGCRCLPTAPTRHKDWGGENYG